MRAVCTADAPVAALAHAACLADGAEVRTIDVFCMDGTAINVMQAEMDGAAFVVHTGFVCLFASEMRTFEVIRFPIFDKLTAGAAEREPHIGVNAFLPEMLHPFKMAGSSPFVIFPVAEDLLNLTGGKILPNAHGADEGRTHDALVLERQVGQDGDALVSAFLVFCRDVEKDVVPAVARQFSAAGRA